VTKHRQRLTVLLIPQSGSRSFSFQLALGWITVAAGLLVGVIVYMVLLVQTNASLTAQMDELDELKRVARMQQVEIDTMIIRVRESQQRLTLLDKLEHQIRDLLGQAPARRPAPAATDQLGRGGPDQTRALETNQPTLSAFLPQEVTVHLFAKRDTVQLHLQRPDTYSGQPDEVLSQAERANNRLKDQVSAMDDFLAALEVGKSALAEHLDFLAHVPTGVPVADTRVTDRFGWRWNPFGWGRQVHNGIDLAHDYWAPIVATGSGVVTHAGWKEGGYGNTVVIDHGYGYVTLYAHMIDWSPSVGERVERGEVIGWVGSTGNSTGPHLHYEVHLNEIPSDPSRYF
jgi:murein DD-endopeptidase MepM/ murein hydrolase activator NlpD